MCLTANNNSGHHTSRFVSEVLRKDSTSRTVDNPRLDFTMLANEEADASHPSEHNPAVDDPSIKVAERAVMTREVEAERRYHNGEKASLYPTHGLWVSLQAERNRAYNERRSRRGVN